MDRKTRAILVGCGGISRAWMKALQGIPEVEMVGLVDIVESAPAKLAEEFNLNVALGSDLGAMLDRVQPDVVFNRQWFMDQPNLLKKLSPVDGWLSHVVRVADTEKLGLIIQSDVAAQQVVCYLAGKEESGG